MKKWVSTHGRLSAKSARIGQTLDGMYVDTIVLINPMQCAAHRAAGRKPADIGPAMAGR